MDKSELNKTLKFTIKIGKQAGKILMKYFRSDLEILTKANQFDLVTIADQESESYLIKKITKKFPNHQILAEESARASLQDQKYTWIIDPLDGTTNFNHGIGHFAVSIALYLGNEALIAVIYNPVTKELFTATKNESSKLNGKIITTSNRKNFNEALLATGFPYDRNSKEHKLTFKLLQEYHKTARGVRRQGAAALDLAFVAAGRLDGFFEYLLGPWDIAAGVLLVKQAGGKIVENTPTFIKVDNGKISWPKIDTD